MSTIRDEFEALLPEPAFRGLAPHPAWPFPKRDYYTADQMRAMFDAATERAAKLCEKEAETHALIWQGGASIACDDCAAAIRAKGGEAHADQA